MTRNRAVGNFIQRACLGTGLLALFSPTFGANAQSEPASFKTPEYYRNWGLEYTNAADAYALGFTGKGIKIAIADTQIQLEHPQLKQRIYWPNPRYEFPRPGYSEPGQFPDHGTHVAGIAAAERDEIEMMGVAFDASIAAIAAIKGEGSNVYPGYPALNEDDWAEVVIDSGASIVNASFNPDVAPNPGKNPNAPQVYFQFLRESDLQLGEEIVRKLADANVVLVTSNGNWYEYQPNASKAPYGLATVALITPKNTKEGYPFTDPEAPTNALYRIFDDSADGQNVNTWLGNQIPESTAELFDFSDLAGALIGVTALKRDGEDWALTNFTNRCGLAADWCIGAPGQKIYSTMPINDYDSSSGTSQAAPFVTGTAALVRQAFPYMTARQVIEILLTTATEIPNLSARDTGHGLVNAGRAVRGPIEFGHPSLIPGNKSIFSHIFAIDTQGMNSVWSNDISGTGGFSKDGDGILRITGQNTYTGDTTISGGRLQVDGSIASSSLMVNSGGAVSGNGELGGTTLRSGALMTPGNSIGAMKVSSTFNQNPGAKLHIEIKGPQNDKISVNGETIVDGEIVIFPFNNGSPFPFFDYQLISSSSNISYGGSINHDAVTSILLSNGANLVIGSDGDGTTFDISWLPKNGIGVVGSALAFQKNTGFNQDSTANILDNSYQKLAAIAGNTTGTSGGNATGDAIGDTGFTTGQAATAGYSSDYINLLDDLVQLTSAYQLDAAINSLSPEPYAAFQSVGLNSLKQQRELLATHAGNCKKTGWVVSIPNNESSAPRKSAKKELPICIFADVARLNSSINGAEGLSSYLSNSEIAVWGVEYLPSSQWSIGAAYGYGNSNLYGMSLTSADVSSTNNSAAIYGAFKPIDRLKIQTSIGYTQFEVEGTRRVQFIGNRQPIYGSTSARGYMASIEAKYDFPINTKSKNDWLFISPIAGVAWSSYQQKGFEESGGGPTDLQINGHTASSLMGTIGFEVATTPIKFTKSGTQSFSPRLAMVYQIDALANYRQTKELIASFADAPGAGEITTQGQNGGANSLTITAGGDLQIFQNAAIYATASYEVESVGSQFGYSGGVRFLF